MSAVTLMTLFAVGVYLMQTNMDQQHVLKQKLGSMADTVNKNTASSQASMKKQEDAATALSKQMTGYDTKLKGYEGNLNNFKSQFEQVNKTFTDMTTKSDNLTKDIEAVKKDYMSRADLAKEVKSEVGTFTKLNVNGRTIFVNKEKVELDGGLTVNGPVNATGGFEFGDSSLYSNGGIVGMKVGNQEVLKMDAQGNTTVPKAFTLTAGDKKAMAFSGADATFYGPTIELDQRMTLGEKLGKTGIHSDKNIGVYIKGKNTVAFTEKGGVEASSISFPEGGDIYTMIKEVQGKVDSLKLAMNKETSSFQIHGAGKKQHTLAADGTMYHAGNVGIGIEKPEAPLHVFKQGEDASMRFQSGSDYMDFGIDTTAQGYVTVPKMGFTMKQDGKNVFTVDNTGAKLQGNLCIEEQCLDKSNLVKMMSTPSQISDYQTKFKVGETEARFAGKQICVNDVCTTDEQFRKMNAYMGRASFDEKAGYSFTGRTKVGELCVGDTCMDETRLNKVLSKLGV